MFARSLAAAATAALGRLNQGVGAFYTRLLEHPAMRSGTRLSVSQCFAL